MLTLNQPSADIFIPDASDTSKALQRTTHLAIGAHQDDLEIFAYNGIADCYLQKDQWFTGVTVTNGAGSSRTGVYANYTDEAMMAVRRDEQNKAAFIGDYAAQLQLDYSSSVVRAEDESAPVVEDLLNILKITQPTTVYLHNPADKHSTHIGVLKRCIAALRQLPAEMRPPHIYGCEVWRDLDWMLDDDKIALPASKYPNLAAALIGVFDSQISGGKRYDLATAGRRLANATYHNAYASDNDAGLTWAMDLKPVVEDANLSLRDYALSYIDRFKNDVIARHG